MTGAELQTWCDANQRYLTAALRETRAALERHAGRESQGDAFAHELAEMTRAMPAPPALETLCAAFGLSAFERSVVLLCAGVELDSSIAELCAAAPTFSLALAALPEAHWSALAPSRPLRYWRLIEMAAGGPLTSSALRIDERILHYLAGISHGDERLAGQIEIVRMAEDLPESHRAIAGELARAWVGATGSPRLPLIQLCGGGRAARRAIAASGCEALGLRLFATSAQLIPTGASELDLFIRLWEREAALNRGALLVECEEFDSADAARNAAVNRLLERAGGAIIAGSRERRRIAGRATIPLEVPRLSAGEQRAAWRSALGNAAAQCNGTVDALAAQFSLSAQSIRGIAEQALGRGDSDQAMAAQLWEACRAQVRPRLEDLAQRIDPAARWDDLVLPQPQMNILHEIAAHVRQRGRVYEDWGFAAKSGRGLGISALFAGPSGTGKTMAAEVLANELRLDLYRIDLSSVVSKYIGETEKNLRRVFDAAEEGGAILLFDEADALFGKRSEVKDSHDRYANIEISYLLQRMESYRGLAILTTNMKSALDTAFLRRIRFVVEFPFPGAEQRAAIWRRVFPADTPTEGLDVERLAALELAGGNIRNIALNAAFLAADAAEPVRMKHLLRAARNECAKLERPLSEAEVAGWV